MRNFDVRDAKIFSGFRFLDHCVEGQKPLSLESVLA